MLNDSYYLFVEVAALRCKQLRLGARPKIELRAHKYSTVARAEVDQDLIPWESVSDEQIAAERSAAAARETAAASVASPGAARQNP